MLKMQVSSVLLFLCVSVLSAECSRYSHPLHRRQASQDDGVCALIALRETCSNGYIQDTADLLGQCNATELAAVLVKDTCRRNSIGSFCVLLDPGSTVDSVCGRSPATCTPECRDLLTTTRAQLGCCVNIFNVTDILGRYNQRPFRYSLWSLCNVEPVTEQCELGPIQLYRLEIDPTCNEVTFFERLLSNILCRRDYIEATKAALGTQEGCRNDSADDQNLQACDVNAAGQYCALASDTSSQLEEVRGNCTDISVCSPQCLQTLRTLDCCFLADFNGTSAAQRDFLSYEFWSRCNLNSPGMCERKLTGPGFNHAPTLKAPGTMIGLTIAILITFLHHI